MNTRNQKSRKTNRTSVGDKISKILRQARRDKHYSLDDLHRITKIKLTYLKAIDSGDFKKVPEGFYLRAYIRKYANVVGLNGIELLRRFNNELPDLQDPRYMDKVSEDKLLVRAAKQRIRNRHSTVRKYIPLLVLIVVIFVILVGIWIVASRSHSTPTANYHDHSTSVSGESSIKRVKHKKRKHHVHKRKLVIKKGVKQADNLVYKVSTKIHPIHVTFESPTQIQLTVNDGKRNSTQALLKADQKKSLKLTKHDKSVQLNLMTPDKIKMKLNHKAKVLNPKRSVKSIVLKFSK